MNKIVLVGSPNTGKTTLYNTLTNENEKASNYGGVTVEVKNAPLYLDKNIMIYDLPGLYSIKAFSPEERVSLNFLDKNKNSLIINICDANNLYRNLFLALELKEQGFYVCLAINMCGGIKNIENIKQKLEQEIGIKCFLIDSRKRKKCLDLIKFIQNFNILNIKLQKNNDNVIIKSKESVGEKYNKINKILNNCGYKIHNENLSKIDKYLFNPHFAIVSFLLLFVVIFYITFNSVGQICSNYLSDAFSKIVFFLLPNLKNAGGWFASLLTDGIIKAICSVLAFLPQITLLYFFLSLMEDTGYLSRVAFALDTKLNKVGLSGRSLFSLLMGFGCTTGAFLTTRNIANKEIRKRTSLILPLYSCSAKLPIFALICSAFFSKNSFWAVMGLYALGVVFSLIIAVIDFKVSGAKNDENFILEMPKLKAPYFPKILKDAVSKTKEFVLRVGSVICLASVVVWFVCHFNFRLEFLSETNGGAIINKIVGVIEPIFKPLGFSSAIILALLSGLVAKEMVLSTLMLVSGATSILELQSLISFSGNALGFSSASAVAFLVFVLLYPVCISAMATEKQELGLRFMLKGVVLQFIIAYVSAAVVYIIMQGKTVVILSSLCVMILVAASVVFVVKYVKKQGGKCYACNHQCKNDCVQKR